MLLLFKRIPIYCSFSNVWTKNNNNEEKAKDPIFPPEKKKIVSLGIHLFQRRTSTGSEPFSLLISLDATIFVLPSVLILIEIIFSKNCSKSRLKSAKSQLPVDVRRCYLNTLLICYTR